METCLSIIIRQFYLILSITINTHNLFHIYRKIAFVRIKVEQYLQMTLQQLIVLRCIPERLSKAPWVDPLHLHV